MSVALRSMALVMASVVSCSCVGCRQSSDSGSAKDLPDLSKPAVIFPELKDNSLPVDVVKLVTRDQYVIAYVQLYVPAEHGRRVMDITAWFKDRDDELIAKTRAAYLYKGFRPNQDNPTVQGDAAEAITMGSLGIDGYSGAQVAIPVENERARKIKKVTVRVIYDEGEAKIGEGS